MKRWIFGYVRSALHAAAENVAEVRSEFNQHAICALCDGEWHTFDYADFRGQAQMPEAWDPAVRICEACRAKWAPNTQAERPTTAAKEYQDGTN